MPIRHTGREGGRDTSMNEAVLEAMPLSVLCPITDDQ